MQKEIQVMRVLRLPPVGKLVIEVNNQRYQTVDEIQTGNIRQMVLAAIGELMVSAGGYQTLVDAGVAPPLPTSKASSAIAKEPEPEALTEQQANFLASLEAEKETLRNKPVKPSPSVFNRSATPKLQKAAKETPNNTLVEQIDKILQKYVEADDDLAKRSIHLKQNPNGGLLIEVDGKYYQRPRELEEAKIKILIKRALKEWETN